jgi:hypothetical protein
MDKSVGLLHVLAIKTMQDLMLALNQMRQKIKELIIKENKLL